MRETAVSSEEADSLRLAEDERNQYHVTTDITFRPVSGY